MPGVFAAGDVTKSGRMVDAIGAGIQVAHYVDLFVRGEAQAPFQEKSLISAKQLSVAYFAKCHHCDLPEPDADSDRCISCGTCRDCQMCLQSCPEKAIERQALPDGTFKYFSNEEKCIGCGICAGVCPCGIWTLQDNQEVIAMYKTY